MFRRFAIPLVLSSALIAGTVSAGSLTPPGPPAPTMKALDQVEARTPISSLPFTISTAGSYYLTANLTYTGSSTAILISAGPTTIDLNGFTITGSGSGVGIAPSSLYDVTVRHGTIRSFSTAVMGATNQKVVVEDLAVDACANGLAGGDMIVTRSKLFGTGTGLGVNTSNVVIVKDTRISGFGIGMLFGPRSIVEDCTLDTNLTGMQMGNYSTLRHSNVVNNLGDGIIVTDDSLVIDNNVSGNGGHGIEVFNGANRIEGNIVASNASFGISVFAAGNFILKNTLRGNSFSTVAGNIAPVDTAGTSTNPWVNFSF